MVLGIAFKVFADSTMISALLIRPPTRELVQTTIVARPPRPPPSTSPENRLASRSPARSCVQTGSAREYGGGTARSAMPAFGHLSARPLRRLFRTPAASLHPVGR